MEATEYISQEINNIKANSIKAQENPYVTRLVYQPVSVEEFAPIIPEANDTGRIQRAFDSLQTDGGRIEFGSKQYNVSGKIQIKRNGLMIIGRGRGSTIFNVDANATDFLFEIINNTYYVTMMDFEINGNASPTALGGIKIINSNECTFERIKVYNFANPAAIGFLQTVRGWNNSFIDCRVQFGMSASVGPLGDAGFSIQGGNYTNIQYINCFTHLTKRGFVVENQSPISDAILFLNCTANNVPISQRPGLLGTAGFYIGDGVINWEIADAHIEHWEGTGESGVYFGNVANGEVRKCGFYACKTGIKGLGADKIWIGRNTHNGDVAGYQAHDIQNTANLYMGPNKVYSSVITIADVLTGSTVLTQAYIDAANTFTQNQTIKGASPAMTYKEDDYTDNDAQIALESGVLKVKKLTDAGAYVSTPFLIDLATGNAQIGQGGYNTGHIQMGIYHLWVDSSARLRIKNGTPASDTDGTIVGTQV